MYEDDDEGSGRHRLRTEPELQNRNAELNIVAEDAAHGENRAAGRVHLKEFRINDFPDRKKHHAGAEKGQKHAPVDGRHLREIREHVKKKHRNQEPEREARERRADLIGEEPRLSEPPADKDEQEKRRTEIELVQEESHGRNRMAGRDWFRRKLSDVKEGFYSFESEPFKEQLTP